NGTWLRALVPLVPRPAVLPLEASPRPTRVRAVLEPGAGRRSCSFSRESVWSMLLSFMSVHLFARHQVGDGADHAAELRAVFLHHRVTDALEAETPQRVTLSRVAADVGTDLGDLELHHAPTLSARASARPAACARRSAAGATSSTGRPRRAATASGSSSCLSASTVARTMLIALVEPSDLDSTSWTPAHSSTARTGPPAITPVPGAAGRSRTTPAASSPWTGCTTVPWMRGTRQKIFFASSTPSEIAAGTSLALPQPTPTVPSPSPTTTRAVKANRRPPLTTFETRLMLTTRSRKVLLSSWPRPRPSPRRPPR